MKYCLNENKVSLLVYLKPTSPVLVFTLRLWWPELCNKPAFSFSHLRTVKHQVTFEFWRVAFLLEQKLPQKIFKIGKGILRMRQYISRNTISKLFLTLHLFRMGPVCQSYTQPVAEWTLLVLANSILRHPRGYLLPFQYLLPYLFQPLKFETVSASCSFH